MMEPTKYKTVEENDRTDAVVFKLRRQDIIVSLQ